MTQNTIKSKPQRATKNNPCPICDGTDFCRFADGYAQCMRVESERPANSGFGGWIHLLRHKSDSNEKKVKKTLTKKSIQKSPHAEATKIHRVYLDLIKRNPLSHQDREYLIDRGIPVEKLNQYGSIRRDKLTALHWHGEKPNGVPGFFRKDGQWVLNVAFFGSEAVMLPSVDNDGLITGLQLRLKTDEVKNRYHWLSSSKEDMDFGCQYLTHCHVAKPSVITDKRVYITEGHFKAEVGANKLGAVFISTPGLAKIDEVIQILNELEAVESVIAYDMDKDGNDYVKKHIEKLEATLKDHDFTITTADWDRNLTGKNKTKGIDDIILANGQITYTTTYISETRVELKTVQQARQEMHEQLDEVFKKSSGYYVVMCNPGVGKTTTVLSNIEKFRRGKKVAFLSDSHMLLGECEKTLTDAGVKYGYLEGRSDDEFSGFYCTEHAEIPLAVQRHQSFFQTHCKTCPLLKECTFHAMIKREMGNDVVIAPKGSILNQSKRLEKFDVIIIDESIDSFLSENFQVPLRDMQQTLQLLAQNEYQESPWYDYLENLVLLVEMSDPNSEYSDIEFEPPYAPMPDLPASIFENGEWIYPNNFLASLEGASVMFNDQGLNVFNVNTSLVNRLKGKLVINLDATPIMDSLELIDENVSQNILNFNIDEKLHVVQVSNVKGSKTQLMSHERYQNEFILATATLVQMFENPLVMTIKSFKDVLVKNVKQYNPNTRFGHFGKDNRGTNANKHCDAYIQIGDYCPNIGYLAHKVKAYAKHGVITSVDKLSNAYSNAERIQGIGRLRSVNRDKVTSVYIVSSRPIEGVKVNEYIEMEQLTGIENKRRLINKQRMEHSQFVARRRLHELIRKGISLFDIKGKDAAIKNILSIETVIKERDKMIMETYTDLGLHHDFVKRCMSNNDDLSHYIKVSRVLNHLHVGKGGACVLSHVSTFDPLTSTWTARLFDEALLKLLHSYQPTHKCSNSEQAWLRFKTHLPNSATPRELANKSGLDIRTVKVYLDMCIDYLVSITTTSHINWLQSWFELVCTTFEVKTLLAGFNWNPEEERIGQGRLKILHERWLLQCQT